jgi:hypothetical protein
LITKFWAQSETWIIFSAVAADESAIYKAKMKPYTVRLKEDLLCAYDKSVRPVVYHGNITFVYVVMLLRSITFVSNSAAISFD